jgi:TonB-dependent SusC/RagA subfamily outer membrane receptor
MKKILIVLFVVLHCSIVFAQNRSISGTVTDNTGSPMPGVTVVVKGTTSGTVTDTNGKFGLNAPEANQILLFSFVGFESQEIDISGKSSIDIQMKASTIGLEEVVAVGYGTQKKVNLSGSVESLKGENLAKRNTVMTSQALQGMAAGVTVTSTSGKPGKENTTIRIRGIGTVNDNNPLVLIDGVASSIDAVDPNDIESMSVLKDAASSSIYGSRAANGVILITTKRGKTDKVSVVYKGSVGFTTPIEYPQNATAWDYMTLYDEANANDLSKDAGVPGGFVSMALIRLTPPKMLPTAMPILILTYSGRLKEKAVSDTAIYVGFSVGNGKIQLKYLN